MPRKQYGEGSLYQRSSDGLWVGTIEAGWTATGSRRRVTVSAKTEAAARKKLRDKRLELDRDGASTASARTTVKQWSETWIGMKTRKVRPKTLADYRSAVRVWIVPTIGHRRLDALTPADVRALEAAQRAAGRTSTTALHTHVVLTAMLRDALVEGHRVPARILAMPRPAKATNDRDALTVDQAIAVLDAAAALPDGSRWVAALLQGMRQAECLGLTWDAVDLAKGLLDVSWQLQALPYIDRKDHATGFRVPDGYERRQLYKAWHLVRPKTARGQRIIPLVPWMAAALTSWKSAAPESAYGLVWARDDGRPRVAKDDTAAWAALQATAEVGHPAGRPFVLHEARNTTATLLLEAGVDPEVIKAILGHSSIVTSRGYMRVNEQMARQAMERVAERLQLGPSSGQRS